MSWAQRGVDLFRDLGLDGNLETANDPFFGRQGLLLAANQSADELKFELLVPIAGPDPTACASFNYHLDQLRASTASSSRTGLRSTPRAWGLGRTGSCWR